MLTSQALATIPDDDDIKSLFLMFKTKTKRNKINDKQDNKTSSRTFLNDSFPAGPIIVAGKTPNIFMKI